MLKISFYGYWRLRFLYGKQEAERWKKVYHLVGLTDELEQRSLKGCAHTGENRSKKWN